MPGIYFFVSTVPEKGKETEAGQSGTKAMESGLKFVDFYFPGRVKLLLNWKYGICSLILMPILLNNP
jgi:hypothetical protein